MQLLPALDLRGGRVVRLLKGDDTKRTVYDRDPLEVLEAYAAAGVERAHVVDLDAAMGEAPQRALLERLAGAPSVPRLQLGGGLRDRGAVEWALEVGFDRLVVTSLMVRNFDLFVELQSLYPRAIVPAVDVERGAVKASGWTEKAGRLEDLAARLAPLPVPVVLVTDIERDGTLEGPNLELARMTARACGAPALLSGGVTSLADLEAARRIPEIVGAIVGRALYDGKLDLVKALAVCAGEPAAQEGTS